MASTTKARDKASSAVEGARPYVQRLIEDEELRDNLREAYDAGRDAYDRGIRRQAAAGAARRQEAAEGPEDRERVAPRRLRRPARAGEDAEERRPRFCKLLFIAFIGAILAIALSEDLRKGMLDQLFGAEEEFEYSSTTSPPAPTS